MRAWLDGRHWMSKHFFEHSSGDIFIITCIDHPHTATMIANSWQIPSTHIRWCGIIHYTLVCRPLDAWCSTMFCKYICSFYHSIAPWSHAYIYTASIIYLQWIEEGSTFTLCNNSTPKTGCKNCKWLFMSVCFVRCSHSAACIEFTGLGWPWYTKTHSV